MGDQVSVAPPQMTDREIREAFLNLAKAMTLQANVVTSQVKAMMTQVNRKLHHVCLIMLALWHLR